jgi:hypothetical protein
MDFRVPLVPNDPGAGQGCSSEWPRKRKPRDAWAHPPAEASPEEPEDRYEPSEPGDESADA